MMTKGWGVATMTAAMLVTSMGSAIAHPQAASELRSTKASAQPSGSAYRVTLCLSSGLAFKLADIWNDPDPRIRASLVREYPAFEGRVRSGARYCD